MVSNRIGDMTEYDGITLLTHGILEACNGLS